MRESRRKKILTWMSGLLCAIATTFWVRGNWAVDDLTLITPYHATSLASGAGGLHIVRLLFEYYQPDWMTEQGTPVPSPDSHWSWDYRSADARDAEEYVGWAESEKEPMGRAVVRIWMDGHPPRWNSESPPHSAGWMLRLPWWLIVLITAMFPAMRLFAMARKGKPHRKGHCPECGYDLRATPRRCPECGYMPR